MAICRQPRGKKTYLYSYKNVREGKKVKHIFQEYLGVEGPDGKPIRKPKRILDKVTVFKSTDYGAVAVLWRLAQELELEEIINSIVTKRKGYSAGRLLVIMAINRCIEPKSLTKFAEWYKRTELPELAELPPSVMSKSNLLSAMGAVCGEDGDGEYNSTLSIEKAIFEKYKNKLPESIFSSVLYDITATLFHGGKCIIAEMGHNSKGIKKKQINIALMVTRKYGIPLFHMVFRGSIRDVRTVGNMLAVMQNFGIKKTVLIWDRGMSSINTINWADEQEIGLVCGLRKGVLEVEKLFQSCEIPEEPSTLVKNFDSHGIYAVGKQVSFFGKKRKVVIYLNTQKRDSQRLGRNEQIKTALEKLDDISHESEEVVRKKVKKILTGVTDYVKVSYSRKNGMVLVNYDLNENELKRDANRDGKYALMSTDLSMGTEDIVNSYFAKDTIEKSFRIIKQVVEIEPLRYRKSFRIKSYTFVCFLAYLLYRILEYRLKDANITESAEDVLEKLNEVEKIILKFGKQSSTRFLNLGDFEKEVLRKLDMKDICPQKVIDRTKV